MCEPARTPRYAAPGGVRVDPSVPLHNRWSVPVRSRRKPVRNAVNELRDYLSPEPPRSWTSISSSWARASPGRATRDVVRREDPDPSPIVPKSRDNGRGHRMGTCPRSSARRAEAARRSEHPHSPSRNRFHRGRMSPWSAVHRTEAPSVGKDPWPHARPAVRPVRRRGGPAWPLSPRAP
jgi:hypothetical protein